MASIPPVKGTRDLYPEDYAPIRRIFDVWRDVSVRHGFEEFEGPTLEYLELYREKSGDELVGQLYLLTDSGGRELALRPEMTPTLARMVAARVHALSKPIKWFCIPTLFRGENVQRGRLREFFQWNVDVIGTADVVGDAEVILVGVEALRELGLAASDFAVHISNRRLMAALLSALGIAENRHGAAYGILDKFGKLPAEEFDRRWGEAFADAVGAAPLRALMAATSPADVGSAVRASGGRVSEALEAAIDETGRLVSILADFGITEFCKFDLRVVRGLAYYTGPVFEFYDRSEAERAICGGGRYDDLLGILGKSKEPAVGFGMGDVVLSLVLADRGLLQSREADSPVYVVGGGQTGPSTLHRVVGLLRRAGIRAEFGYRPQALNKQLKAADKRGARQVVILAADDLPAGRVRIRQLSGPDAGRQREVSLDELAADPCQALRGDR
jgi:histidyl-tRNA synthetase